MSDITLFKFEGSNVRVQLDAKGEPWFVAKDIAEALGYEWNGSARVQHVPERWRVVTSVVTTFGLKDTVLLSESGLNFFVMRSDKPKALPFQEWLAGEVLPSIRKTGSYSRNPVPPSPVPVLSAAAESRATIFEVAAFMQKMVPTITSEMATACTLRALEAGGHLSKSVHEEMRNMLSVDWDKAPSLTPTQIGLKLDMKAEQVNKLLAACGLQKKLGKRWEPTEAGKEHAGAVPYQSEYGEHKGIQLKWAPEVLKILQASQLPAQTDLSDDPITIYMSKKN